MARRKKGKRQDLSGEQSPLTQNPFAQLAGVRDQLAPAADEASTLPEHASATPADEPAVQVDDGAADAPVRAVLRYERKGRGGKEVTVVEQLSLSDAELERWLARIKRELGCGGSRDGEVLVLQGDQRARLEPLLRRLGVGRVSRN